MRDTIILAGGFDLDRMGASAVRALGLAALFERCGYKALILGKFGALPPSDGPFERSIAGIACRDIRRPAPGGPFASYTSSAAPLGATVELVGVDRVKAISAYNYPALGALAMIRYCREVGISPILDCTEWQIWEGRRVLRNLWRLGGLETRMRFLTYLAGNVICASTWFEKRLTGLNTVVLPFALDTSRNEWRRSQPDCAIGRVRRFVYSGSPGLGLVKDRLQPIIEAFSSLMEDGRVFDCTIIGITRDEYLQIVPRHAVLVDRLKHRLTFLGRIPHDRSLEIVRDSDFVIFFRKPDRVANTGFATKFVEAATLGIPIITNATSDILHYLDDGINGFIAEGVHSQQVTTALRRAIDMTSDEFASMISAARQRNPFDIEKWVGPAQSFLDGLRA
jgi:glycosyltransferase involved in cell wall biosynthesis